MNAPKLPVSVKRIIKCLNSGGHRADVVGGCVRDFLIGKAPIDYDITTDASPDRMKELFRNFRTVDTGIKHGTLTVMVDGAPYEVTTYRRDGEYTDHRHPETVDFTENLAEDLARRDFTMNAIAYNEEDGFTDIFGGIEDIKNGIIRAVGDPNKRFEEDALRILRAVRFSSSLDFKIEEKTALAVREKADLVRHVSGERIFVEWKKLLSGVAAYRVLSDYYDVIRETVIKDGYVLPAEVGFTAADSMARHFSLYAKNPRPVSSFLAVCDRLRADNGTRTRGCAVLRSLTRPVNTPTDIKLCLADIGTENTTALLRTRLVLGTASEGDVDNLLNIVKDENAVWTLASLAVNGTDLISLGISGRAVGKTLALLLDGVIRGTYTNNREALVALAKQINSIK